MGLITLQGDLLALAGVHKIIKSYRFMMIMTGRKKECGEHHLYNELATESGTSALTTKLPYNFMHRIHQHHFCVLDSSYLWSLAASNR